MGYTDMKFYANLVALLMCLTSVAQANTTCPEPNTLVYPLGKLIEREALTLEFDFDQTANPEFGTQAYVEQRHDTVLANLAGKSPAEQDALLLGRLSWSTKGTIPLLGITAFAEAGLFDTYLDVLERHDMRTHAAALKTVRAAFPNWDTTADERYKQWNSGSQQLDPVLDAALRAQSWVFVNAQPTLLDKAEDILNGDPVYESYLVKRDQADTYELHTYMMQTISNCIQRYDTPRTADEALASVPQTIADLYVVDLFLLENGNGGMHQYIFNSTGALAPNLSDVMTRWGLFDQAQSVQEAMAHFPTPYPRETQTRRAIMAEFSSTTDNALNSGTWIGDDMGIWDKVQEIAIREGYWPQ